jgi:hypothetical protein
MHLATCCAQILEDLGTGGVRVCVAHLSHQTLDGRQSKLG